ncbi:TolC family protein [Tichowtungia aerotolerans]|uniref:TolC family protein n=1 Tax=Tichowtungia aerotolerans TaxID=2697043 RepID=A0A6P1M2A3_9BACT|nr:TolC family protein [Tichowtungia aerotolerans]QHI68959.1 TolC family protein [Tichowtungia aerotolerans]
MKIIYLTATLAICGQLAAQTNGVLTWDQCLKETKTYSPNMISAKAAVRELQHNVVAATAGFLPQINASAKHTKSGSRADDSASKEQDSTSAGLSLSQSLYSGGANTARREQALIRLNIGKEQYRATLSDIEQQARLAYIDVLYAQELIDLTRKITDRRANNVRLIQLRFDGGRENAGSLARSKAQLKEAEFEEREAHRSLDYALKNLSAAIGRIEPIAGVAGALSFTSPDPLANLQVLTRQTPNYLIAEKQVESARQGLTVTRSERFPSIKLSASTGLAGEQDLRDESWSMGVSASIPLFTGRRLTSEVLAANEQVIQTEMDLIDTGNSIMASLQGTWNNYTDAVEYAEVQKTLLDAEVLRAEISTAKYKQGLLDYEDWDIIESNLISQNKLHLQRQRAAAVQEANWRNALGQSVWATTEESN